MDLLSTFLLLIPLLILIAPSHHLLQLYGMKIPIFLISAVAASVKASAPLQNRESNWTIGQTVQTTSGPVNGHAALNESQVSEYLGIPFAKPPVGDLRFAAPVAYRGNATLNGTNFVRQTLSRLLLSHQLLIPSVGLYMSCSNHHIQRYTRSTFKCLCGSRIPSPADCWNSFDGTK